jgi:glycosyltransferase involved in cell wall biosynthesis
LVKDQPWRLEVIGEGPLGAEMREAVQENGLADRVKFSGWLSAEQVSERFGASDILLMTSTSEGLPMAGIEALLQGLAIVGSRIGGLMDVVADGSNGLLCDLAPEAFATGLRSVLGNPERLLAMRRASLAKAVDFSLPDRLDDYERVLESAAR